MSKIFVGLLTACALLVAFFTYYSWSWLNSIGAPATAIQGYKYSDDIAWVLLIGSSVILLIFGNVILWTTRRAWALWATFLYFAIFVLIRYFMVSPAFFEFGRSNGVSGDSISTAPLLGALFVIVAAIFTFCDQFAVLQLHRTMYPLTAEIEREVIETPVDKDSD